MCFLKKAVIFTATFILIIALLFLLVGTIFYFYSSANIDKENDERLFALAKENTVSRIYVNSAPLFSGLYTPEELTRYGKTDTRKDYLSLSEINEYVIYGFLATEDREYYEHKGVNLRRTIAAFLNTIFRFEDRFGASTITQQVIKNISGDNEITIKRKLNEIIRAYLMEKNHTKDEILEVYINIVPLSERCVGVGMGSRIYFNKEAFLE